MKETKKTYGGVIVPMITPLNEDLTLDIRSVSQIMETFTKNNIATFILGTTGESVSLTESLRTELVKVTVREKSDKIMVYAGISGNCLNDSIDTGNKYAGLGIDAVVIHLPFFYPISESGMLNYFETIADSVGCPVILYNNPLTVRLSIPLKVIDKLSSHSNIVGFKDSENSRERIDKAIELWKDRSDFAYLMGCAVHSSYALEKGCNGIVPSAGNLVPELFKKLYDAAINGNSELALEYQQRTNEISDIYQSGKNISEAIPALKVLMSEFELSKIFVMPPMIEPDSKEQLKLRSKIREVMKAFDLISK